MNPANDISAQDRASSTNDLRVDLVVLGSGVAGLSSAIMAMELGLRVAVVTKGQLDQGTTRWAQGGVAAALDRQPESLDVHLADTLAAGAGLCDAAAVECWSTKGRCGLKSSSSWEPISTATPTARTNWPVRVATRCFESFTPADRPRDTRWNGRSWRRFGAARPPS